jgi:hypothetical protein
MKLRMYDVQPSPENKGLIYRAKISEGCTEAALKEHLAEVERVTQKHLAVTADYERRDHIAETENGLPLVGPSSGDFNSAVARAHNYGMAVLSAKLSEIDRKIAELAADLAALQNAKK